MATTDTFSCSVVTPECMVLECDANFVAFAAHDGEMGVLNHRAPLVCKLGMGTLRIDTPSEKHRFFIDEGFAQMVDNRLTLLTQQARKVEALSREAAREELERARAMPTSDEHATTTRDKAIQRARAKIKLATA